MTGEILMQLEPDFFERVIGEAEGFCALRGFDLKQHHAVRRKPVGGELEQAADHIETVRAAIESQRRFLLIDGKPVQGFSWDIGQVGADQVEVALGGERVNVLREQVTLQEVNAVVDVEFFCVVSGDFERVIANIGGKDAHAGDVHGNRDGDRAGACANVGDGSSFGGI